MAWALWLAVPIAATVLAAVGTWWSARRTRPAKRADAADAMQAHRNYLDALTVPELRDVIAEVLTERPEQVVVDLALVTLLDSSGVGAIVSLFKRLKAQGGAMRVVGAQGQPLAVLELLKLDAILGC